jgi:hypothetical protein
MRIIPSPRKVNHQTPIKIMKQKFDPTNLITYVVITLAALTMMLLAVKLAGDLVASVK